MQKNSVRNLQYGPETRLIRGIYPAVQAFSLGAKFARKIAMLKLPEERRKLGGDSKGAGSWRRERRDFFFSPPPPLFLLSLSHLPKGLLFLLSLIFHCHKIKDGGYNNITNTNPNTPALQANFLFTGKLFVYLGPRIFVSMFVNLLNGSLRKLKVRKNRRNEYFFKSFAFLMQF